MEGEGRTLHHNMHMENMDFYREGDDSGRTDRVNCTCETTRKMKKRSYRISFVSNLKLSLMTFVAVALLVRPPGSGLALAGSLNEYELCRRGEYYEDYALKGGSKAGTYIKLHGSVRTFDDCVDLCCQDKDCRMALMLRHSCFRVDCRKGEPHRCERISARRSRFNPKLFIRGEVERPMKGMLSLSPMTGSEKCSGRLFSLCKGAVV